jgi:hypothetical protein
MCPLCGGTGLATCNAWREKARKGGIMSFLVSLEPGRPSMSERGKHRGRLMALRIQDVERREAAPGPTHRR